MPPVTLLASGFGLGFYVPALLMRDQLERRHVDCETVVLENYFQPEKKQKIPESRSAYHRDFATALVAQRLPMDIRDSFDPEAAERLLSRWEREGRTDFIVLSGHWVHLLRSYERRLAKRRTLSVDLVYMDSEPSPSWKSLQKYVPDYADGYRKIRLFDADRGTVPYRLPVGTEEPIPYERRSERYVVHGGGWGMGTYLDKIEPLRQTGASLDVVVSDPSEAAAARPGDRCFMIDPGWEAWQEPESAVRRHPYPPFGEVVPGRPTAYASPERHHALYGLIREARAIVSKTGGGTLVDSLESATPLVMLEPFGSHERRNAELWERLGCGIPYSTWEQSGFAVDKLVQLHRNLLAVRESGQDYIQSRISR